MFILKIIMYTCGQSTGKNFMNKSIEFSNNSVVSRKRELDTLELKGAEILGADIRHLIEEYLAKEKNPRYLASTLIELRKKLDYHIK